MTAERWRPVVGFPNYDVSDQGRIRRALTARGPGSTPGHIRRLWISSSTGYAETVLYLPPRRPLRRTVHSLVAEAFIGPCPPGMEILHGDGDRANAALSNLHYGTRGENHRQAYAQGRRPTGAAGLPGEANHAHKLTETQVRAIRSAYRPGDAPRLAAQYGVSRALILAIHHRRIWKHVDSEPCSVPTEPEEAAHGRR